MPYSPLFQRLPEIARRETRSVTVLDSRLFELPPANYTFLEMYCDEPGCDCRRVFFSVTSSIHDKIIAVIAWGWEDISFYRRWMGSRDPEIVNDLKGPVLNLTSPQSNLAPAVLKLFQSILLRDRDYIERIKRHYVLFRETVDGKMGEKRQQRGQPQQKVQWKRKKSKRHRR